VLADRGLPPLVRAYADRSAPDTIPLPGQVELTQEGTMWTKPGGRALRFTATQHSCVPDAAFAWRARFRIARILTLEVVASYADGAGALAVRALGRTIQKDDGPEISAGEALRYLAELPWVPHAMAGNDALRWQTLDERRVQVHLEALPALRVTFEFDAAGDIVRASSADRLLRLDGRWTARPWSGEFSEYRELGGMRMPAAAEVSWELPEGRYVYWRGRVVAARALSAAFAPAR
jgi:hypothetical protein